MHVFQPIPVDELELNPFESIGKDWALVSAGTKQKANTMTVGWGGIGVLWGKNVVVGESLGQLDKGHAYK